MRFCISSAKPVSALALVRGRFLAFVACSFPTRPWRPNLDPKFRSELKFIRQLSPLTLLTKLRDYPSLEVMHISQSKEHRAVLGIPQCVCRERRICHDNGKIHGTTCNPNKLSECRRAFARLSGSMVFHLRGANKGEVTRTRPKHYVYAAVLLKNAARALSFVAHGTKTIKYQELQSLGANREDLIIIES
jgi:hypothetical protein